MLALQSGTKIYRSLGTREHFKEFEATLFNEKNGVMRIEVDRKTQPMSWEKQATTFHSLTQWAMTCADVVLGNDTRHAVNGWKVCYVKTGDKRVYLHSFREGKVQSQPNETEEMPKAKPLPKEPVPIEKSILKSFPVIKKVYFEDETQPETLATDTQKLWKEVIGGKERWVCEEGFIFEVGTDGEPGAFVGKK